MVSFTLSRDVQDRTRLWGQNRYIYLLTCAPQVARASLLEKYAIILHKCELSGSVSPSAAGNFTHTRRCGITGTRISRFALERRARRYSAHSPAAKSAPRVAGDVDAHADKVCFLGQLTPRPDSQKASLMPGASYMEQEGVTWRPGVAAALEPERALTRRRRNTRRWTRGPSPVATRVRAAAAGVEAAAAGRPSCSRGARR